MKNKISDFLLASTPLRLLCRAMDTPFVDLEVSFGDMVGLDGNSISVGKPKNIAHTSYLIASEYIKNDTVILDKPLCDESQKDSLLVDIATCIRSLSEGCRAFDEAKTQDLVLSKLYQRPFIWIMMRDIICPFAEIQPQNLKVVSSDTPYVDVARYYEENELEGGNYEHVFVNMGVSNTPISRAFVLKASMEAHGIDPLSIMREITASQFYETMMGLVKIAFVDDNKVDDFLVALFSIIGLAETDTGVFKESISSEVVQTIKTSQSAHYENAYEPFTWWYLGLIEKMLEPVRGPDWGVHNSLEPYIEQFWNKVESVRQDKAEKGNRDGVPFNTLLRLKTEQTSGPKQDTGITLQGLLSSNRIW